MAIKLLIGGSPCTHWSIAQSKNRETKAEGVGWELFKNYLIAREKFKPDFFMYENNKSAAQPIKDQISLELGVDLMYINSALVSAQHRQRFYAFNWTVEQPEDRGLVLKDILESGENLSPREKSYCLTASYGGAIPFDTLLRGRKTMIAEPVTKRLHRLGGLYNQDTRWGIWDANGVSPTLTAAMGMGGGHVPMVAHPSETEGNCQTNPTDEDKIYEVKNGQLTLRGQSFDVALEDGFYAIRKLTVKECCRLQTMPDDYCKVASKSTAYKALGNGWTAEVIIHILQGALRDISRDTEIIVLSLYDGIATGRYCLDKLGFTNVTYHAYEIDEKAMAIAMDNYPDIIQHGDAFAVRENSWKPPQTRSEWLNDLLEVV